MATLTATATPEGYEPPQRSFKPFPDNSRFKVEIVGIKEEMSRWKDKDTGEHVPLLNFQFKVLEGENFGNRRFFGDCPAEFFPGSKLFNWVVAILNTDIQPGFQLNTDDLIGLKTRATIGYRTWERQDGTTGWANNVRYLDPYDPTEVLPDVEEMADPNEGATSSGGGGGTTFSYDDAEEPF